MRKMEEEQVSEATKGERIGCLVAIGFILVTVKMDLHYFGFLKNVLVTDQSLGSCR